jgi:hypothetical protein
LCEDDAVIGAVLIVIALVVVIPVSVTMTGAIVATLLGWNLRSDAEATHAGSELVELNR